MLRICNCIRFSWSINHLLRLVPSLTPNRRETKDLETRLPVRWICRLGFCYWVDKIYHVWRHWLRRDSLASQDDATDKATGKILHKYFQVRPSSRCSPPKGMDWDLNAAPINSRCTPTPHRASPPHPCNGDHDTMFTPRITPLVLPPPYIKGECLSFVVLHKRGKTF